MPDKIPSKALGRGLGALIPAKNTKTETASPTAIDITKISPNKNQPRKFFDDEKLHELVASVKAKGIIQPILVRRLANDRYEIIAGERRYRAALALKLKAVPCTIRAANDNESLEMALIENIQRDDLNPVDQAKAYQKLIEKFGLTHQEISLRVGKDRTTITNILRILGLPQKVLRHIEREKLSLGHAKLLCALSHPHRQEQMADLIIRNDLSVRDAEKILNKSKALSVVRASKDRNILKLEEELSMIFGTKVIINNKKNNRGKLSVEYYSLKDLDRILAIIKGAKKSNHE